MTAVQEALDMLREEEMKAYNAMLLVDNWAPDSETLVANANYQTTKRLYAKARVILFRDPA